MWKNKIFKNISKHLLERQIFKNPFPCIFKTIISFLREVNWVNPSLNSVSSHVLSNRFISVSVYTAHVYYITIAQVSVGVAC